MNHQDYVTRRSDRDPEFRRELAIATAELKLATAIAERRMATGIALSDLAMTTGISEERLVAIEDGDAITVSEILAITHVLHLTIDIGPDFRLSAAPAAQAALKMA